MSDIRLTRRGKIVVGLLIAGLVIGFNIAMSGKYVSCDLRDMDATGCQFKDLP